MPDFDRFRSFAERYVIARAPHFRVGHEREDAWLAMMDAKTVYGNIAGVAKLTEPAEDAAPTQSQNVGQGSTVAPPSTANVGLTGGTFGGASGGGMSQAGQFPRRPPVKPSMIFSPHGQQVQPSSWNPFRKGRK